jgi:hypothetical protein
MVTHIGFLYILKPFKSIIANLYLTKLGFIRKFRPKRFRKIGSRLPNSDRPFTLLSVQLEVDETHVRDVGQVDPEAGRHLVGRRPLLVRIRRQLERQLTDRLAPGRGPIRLPLLRCL